MEKKPVELNISLEDFRTGDESTFLQVKEKLSPELITFANALMPKDSDAGEKIVDDTFERLKEMRQRMESLSNVKAFLYITLRNRCLDYLRHLKFMKDKYEKRHRRKLELQLSKLVPEDRAKKIAASTFKNLSKHYQHYGERTFARKYIYEPALRKSKRYLKEK